MRGQDGRPGTAQAGEGDSRAALTCAQWARATRLRRASDSTARHGDDGAVMLGPHERSREAGAGEDLGHLGPGEWIGIQSASFHGAEHPVKARGAKGVEPVEGHDPAGVCLKSSGKEVLVGEHGRPKEDLCAVCHFRDATAVSRRQASMRLDPIR